MFQGFASTLALSNEVSFAAYLAVLLGTFLPCMFLVVLYAQVQRHNTTFSCLILIDDVGQTESRKAGLRAGKKGLAE